MHRTLIFPGLFLVCFSIQVCKSVPVQKAIGQTEQHLRGCGERDIRPLQHTADSIESMRREYGIHPLESDPALGKAAQEQLQRLLLLGTLSHYYHNAGPDERLRLMGIDRNLVGENMARFKIGSKMSGNLIAYWADRKTERDNLRNPDFSRMGFAWGSDDTHCYYVLLLSN